MHAPRHPTSKMIAHGVAAAWLVACFEGDYAQGLPCTQDADCGPSLTCIEGLCGGPGNAALCGNGLIDVGEACDDGNANNGDGCTPGCQLPTCGDGFVAPNELCDDGNTLDGDDCPATCSECGNGRVETIETCDDGNTLDEDACTPVCSVPVCGDGFLAPDEACDDGNQSGTDACTPTCKLPTCGDGFVNVEGEVCDDGNTVETDACTSACTESPQPPTLDLELAQIKQFELGWSSLGAAFFRLSERVDADGPWVQIGDSLEGDSLALTVPLHFRAGSSYRIEACNADASVCRSSDPVPVVGDLGQAVGYFKASNPGFFDEFGKSVALSGDGNTLAVGAPSEDGEATDVNPPHQDDNSAVNAGAVYVFVREGSTWVQQAYIKAHNTGEFDTFGGALALSDDGDTLAVGAPFESSAATGIDEHPYNNGAPESGAVYVFARAGGTWSRQAYIKADNTAPGRRFGWKVSLSNDGDTLATLQSAANLSVPNQPHQPGDAFVFVREGETWAQQQRISGVWVAYPPNDRDGNVALSGDGASLAIAEVYDGQYGAPGPVHMYAREGQQWSLTDTIDAPTVAYEAFGRQMTLSDDGTTAVMTGYLEDSGATGVNGDPLDQSAGDSGAAWVYTLDGGSWTQQAYLKSPNTVPNQHFGAGLASSASGDVLAICSGGDHSGATGVGGDPFAEDAGNQGAVVIFVRERGVWAQRSYVKAPYPDVFGCAVSLSDEGETLAVGSPTLSLAGSGVSATPDFDEGLHQSGAVFLY